VFADANALTGAGGKTGAVRMILNVELISIFQVAGMNIMLVFAWILAA
jgi:hypothetical protein